MDGLMQAVSRDEAPRAGSQAANSFIATVYFKQATGLLDRGLYAEAEHYFSEVLKIWPDHAASLNNLGTSVWRQGRLKQAEELHRRALELNPDDYAILNNLGNVLWEQAQFDEAVEFYRAAVKLRPDSPEALMNFGVTLADFCELDQAFVYMRESLRLMPASVDCRLNLGNLYAMSGDYDSALACYDEALALRPDHPESRRNQSYIWLARGDFERGWAGYEWRLKCDKYRIVPVDTPRWCGEAIDGGSILLVSEQGLGDTLQFIRFAPEVKERVPRVTVACPAPLIRLLSQCAGVDLAVDWKGPLPACDVHIPLMSLPFALKTKLDAIPAEPYLSVDNATLEKWRPVVARALFPSGTARIARPHSPARPRKIGITWQGNQTNTVDRGRSFPIEHFAHIAAVPGVELISLQKGFGTEQLAALNGRFPITDLFGGKGAEDDQRDFLDTAALMTELDLVISPDSSVAHLAGGLGVPIWVALPAVPEWRWLIDRDDTPWYPSMRLFRQPSRGDWEGVFMQMADALLQMNAQKSTEAAA